nr:chemotaxis protein CheA [uncultured Dethiosulfovibrio sp.]
MANDPKDLVDDIIGGNEQDSEFLQDFLVETREHLSSIEIAALELENGGDMNIVHGIFRSFHTIKGLAGFVNQPLVQKIAHRTETILDGCRKGTVPLGKPVVDGILASSDLISRICSDLNLLKDQEFTAQIEAHLQYMESKDWSEVERPREKIPGKIGEVLIRQGKLDREDVEALLQTQQEHHPDLKFGQVAVKEGAITPDQVVQSLRSQETPQVPPEEKEVQEKPSAIQQHHPAGDQVRIPTYKLDNLVNMLGELLITQSQVEQEAISRFGANDSLVSHLLRMSRITKEIQNTSMSLSMISLKTTLQKIQRIARDTVQELGKSVDFRVSGEETEIDRGVAEKILDPLVHLVKNAISHGIELPEDREAKGKARTGTVSVDAYSKRGSVYIEISDDGKGLNTEVILKKAIEKKLADQSRNYSDDEILSFIFLPGFSTLQTANNISGRGVGMDVVRTEISKTGGKVEIKNSPGQGCSFVLKIPINMAVLNGTVLDILGEHYIIPTLNVKQILKPEEHQWISVGGKEIMLKVRDSVIPMVPIATIFDKEEQFDRKLDGELMVLIELEHQIKALPVRSVIGRQEIVVKPLGKEFGSLEFVSGASILGDGKVSLILDVEALFRDGGESTWSSSAANI